ncbi:hypothetical protein [Granulicella sp. dw_53]|uniref:hypothetical protein n=1 Tax=Granulicella sp. dw_53 TaxID=2719792 RepID=UPI001BD1E942|nr:hypothetical protein [Granulicella sp. dw_53]
MDTSTQAADQIRLIKEYFLKGDAGDPTILDLFADDVEIRSPKFGTRSGKTLCLFLYRAYLG